MKSQLRIGIEIESIVNQSIHNTLRIGQYHEGVKLSKYWETQRDGSLYSQGAFPISSCIEFVSFKLKGKRGYFKAIEEFIKILSKNGKYKLSEVIKFNSSCGNHLHIGFNDNKKIKDRIDFEILEQLREMFFKKLKDSTILHDDTKRDIKNQYYRSMATKLTKRDYSLRHTQRMKEFNSQGERERDNKGFEWRSFNLMNVKDWKEFREMFNIGFECLDFLFNKRRNGYTLKKKAIRIKKKELKDILDNDKKVLDINLNSDGVVLNV